MNIRDLKSEQIKELKADSNRMLKTRQQAWKNATPKQETIYEAGYADGVRAALKLLASPNEERK